MKIKKSKSIKKLAMKVILTAAPGTEDIVMLELKEKIKNAKVLQLSFGFQGRILIEVQKKEFKKLFKMKSIHNIIEFIAKRNIASNNTGLKDIYEFIHSINFKPWLKNVKTFRITSQRYGEHEFTSIDVQKVAGQAMLEKYPELRVDLENFDLNVKVDVYGNTCYVGILHTRNSLHFRDWRVYNHPASLKPTLAYALIKIASIKKNETVLDPMCGGGTILIEAALEYGKKAKYFGIDISKKYLEGAKKNARKAGVASLIKFKQGDCRKLEEYFEEKSVNKIITNPPYGVRMGGDAKKVLSLYRKFLESSHKVLADDGRIVILTLRAGSFRHLILKQKLFVIEHERVVLHGNLYPHVFVLKKL